MYQTVFQRYEKKYLLDRGQWGALGRRLEGRVEPDRHGEYPVFSLYYDTEDYALARSSRGAPLYKEKLRLRSYGRAEAGDPVFLELKKKFRGIVYKRRIPLPAGEAAEVLRQGPGAAGEALRDTDPSGQILREITGFTARYPGLSGRVFLACDRIALSGIGDRGLRITFDTNIRFRREDLRLNRDGGGEDLLDRDRVLLEVKSPGAIPLWLCRALSDCAVFPVSFSKYGRWYQNFCTAAGGRAIPHFSNGKEALSV